jgi:hypothetical protein
VGKRETRNGAPVAGCWVQGAAKKTRKRGGGGDKFIYVKLKSKPHKPDFAF